ncbi:MAG: DMT family transporter [Rhodospirillales bacterium]|nr:DMT family transporter [Rhodospirillales bacterium]
MTNFFLYATTVLVWGTSWIAVQFQLGPVAPEISVAYRFILAAIMLVGFCLITGKKMAFDIKTHGLFAIQGLFLFCLNFYLIYLGSQFLASGLVSIVFSTLSMFNIMNAAIFFKISIKPRVLLGAGIGFIGLSAVFSPELKSFSLDDDGMKGLLLCLSGTGVASLGMMFSLRNKNAGIPMIQTNAWGMVYGAVFMSLIALSLGKEFILVWTPGYVISLLHLSLFATVIGFAAYLTLQMRIGPDKAAYTTVLFPLIALTISTFVENYTWSIEAVVGVGFVLWGNLLVMTKTGSSRATLKRIVGVSP